MYIPFNFITITILRNFKGFYLEVNFEVHGITSKLEGEQGPGLKSQLSFWGKKVQGKNDAPNFYFSSESWEFDFNFDWIFNPACTFIQEQWSLFVPSLKQMGTPCRIL